MRSPHRLSAVLAVLPLALSCEVLAPVKQLATPDSGSGTMADGNGDARDAADAVGEPGRQVVTCDRKAPFGEPVLVFGLNRDPGTEWRVRLSDDELTAYLAIGASWPEAHLAVAQRARTDQPFGGLTPLPALNGSTFELSVSVTTDGLNLFVDSRRPDWSGRTKVYRSSRSAPGDAFLSLNQFALDGESTDNFDPYVVPDGSAIYFVSTVGGMNSIYRAAIHGNNVESPTLIPLPTSARYPLVSPDELTLYFADDNSEAAWGDIFMATRASRDVPFGTPTYISELNSPETGEVPQWISPDGCRLYFSRIFARRDSNLVVVREDSYSLVADRLLN